MLNTSLPSSAFQHTAARRRLIWTVCRLDQPLVSTHSRPKAAGGRRHGRVSYACFNTQPPEGGCFLLRLDDDGGGVSTHSRPKAADEIVAARDSGRLFQHTAARRRLKGNARKQQNYWRFNTQPPEGGWRLWL